MTKLKTLAVAATIALSLSGCGAPAHRKHQCHNIMLHAGVPEIDRILKKSGYSYGTLYDARALGITAWGVTTPDPKNMSFLENLPNQDRVTIWEHVDNHMNRDVRQCFLQFRMSLFQI